MNKHLATPTHPAWPHSAAWQPANAAPVAASNPEQRMPRAMVAALGLEQWWRHRDIENQDAVGWTRSANRATRSELNRSARIRKKRAKQSKPIQPLSPPAATRRLLLPAARRPAPNGPARPPACNRAQRATNRTAKPGATKPRDTKYLNK